MPKGIALTIGLNSVSLEHYYGWEGKLNSCEADAKDMADIAKTCGFQSKTLITSNATRNNVIDEISKATAVLEKGDIFLLAYSGHGGQLPDLNSDEPEGLDETWCLYDGQIVDDEIYNLLSKIASGVRIIVLSDSCHSGDVTKAALSGEFYPTTAQEEIPRYKAMPLDVIGRVYRKNKEFYDSILTKEELANAMDKMKASNLLISGCQSNQLSRDGAFNSLFTGTLLRVWNNGKFKPKGRLKGYQAFHDAIVKRMPPEQTPNYFFIGKPNRKFERQKPFTI